MPRRLATLGALAAVCLVWGTTWAAIRIGLAGIPPLAGVALRFAIAGSFLLVLVPVFGVRLGGSRREVALWAVNGLLSFTVSYSIVYWGEQYVPSGLAAVLFATFPLWVAVLAHRALPDERLRPKSAVGVLVGFAGVAVIFSGDLASLGGPRVAAAAAVFLLAPLVSAAGNVAVKRWGEGVHPLSLTAVPMLGTAVVTGGLSWLVESGRPRALSVPALAAVLYLALCGSALTFTLYFWLLARMKATHLSLVNYVVPVVAVAVGALALGEPVTGRLLGGAALVILGVALAAGRGRAHRGRGADLGRPR